MCGSEAGALTQLVGVENKQLLQKTSDKVLRLQNDSATTLLHMYLIESKAWAIQRRGFLCNRQKLQEPRGCALHAEEWETSVHLHSSTQLCRDNILHNRDEGKNPGKKECIRPAVSWGQAGWAGERVP